MILARRGRVEGGDVMMTAMFTAEFKDQQRRRLEEERQQILERITALTAAEQALAASQGEESDAGGGQADVASDVAEQALDLTLERAEREHLAEVDAALRRLEEGRYGMCDACGLPIPIERLQALPWARLCVRCAEDVQRGHHVKGERQMSCKDRLESFLRRNHVSYQVQHHPLAYTAQEVAASEHVPGKKLAKVVVATTDGSLYLLALPATHRVDLTEVERVVGRAPVRLAREEEFAAALPDCEVGAMPPFGNLYGLPVYVDKALAEDDVIVFQAGTHTDTISMAYADFERLVKPTVGRFARHA